MLARQRRCRPARRFAALASARVKMLQRRAQRSLPVDRKGLTAWNGLALSALASAYAASGDTAYVTQAEALVSFILERWWDGKRLVRAVQGEEVLAPATLEDYALVAQGLWDWRRQKLASVDQRVIEQMVRSAWQRYFVDDRWVMSDAALIPMLDERIALEDGALPSVTAVIVDLSRQLQGLRDDAGIQKKVRIHLQQVRTRLSDSAYWYAGYLGLLAADQPLR